MPAFDKRLEPGSPEQVDYVQRIWQIRQHFKDTSIDVHRAALDNWDLFLAEEDDTRDPVDEKWRSRIFVPLPFSATRTKAAQEIELLGNTEPVWQVEATREEGQWYEESKSLERLLNYTHYQNAWRKFLYKGLTMRSVMGTLFVKINWQRRAHKHIDIPSTEDQARFLKSIESAKERGVASSFIPDWRTEPERFATWRATVNKAGLHGEILEPPNTSGMERELVEYAGPWFRTPSLWSVILDPLIDEIADQKVIIHRVVVPYSYLEKNADDDPLNPDKPYILANVQKAGAGLDDNMILTTEEQELAEKMGLNPQQESHPYLVKPVVIYEVYSFEEDFKHAIIMSPGGNGGTVINKRPFEHPLLTTSPNILAVRNILVPGHMYGLSDYHEPKFLFDELNRFRRLRMDRAVLTTLGVYAKTSGVRLGETVKKIHPGLILDVMGAPASSIVPLLNDHVPPEAYKEPAEMKLEIEDAIEVPNYAKGLAATVSRVTGTEFQGRANQVGLKFKVDAGFIEDELLMMPAIELSFWAQLGDEDLQMKIGGDPNALVSVSRDKLVQAIGYKWRMRGATKHIDANLTIQQLTTALREFPDIQTPQEKRDTLQLILELLDIRGTAKILSEQGAQQVMMASQAQTGAATAQAGAAQSQAEMQASPAPAKVGPGEAQAIGQGQPAPAAPAPGGANAQ